VHDGEGSEQTRKRPIIFVSHGLDGIMVKSESGISEDILIRLTDGHRRSWEELEILLRCSSRDPTGYGLN
jgi:hypothetical protein